MSTQILRNTRNLVSDLQPSSFLLFLCALLPAAGTAWASDLTTAHGTVAVDAYNGIAATADRSGLVRLFNVAAPDRPLLLSNFSVPGTLSSVSLAGNSLLAAGQGGVQILDISDPRSPRIRQSIELDAEPTVVKSAGNLGYAAYQSTVVLFDIQTGKILDRHSYSNLPVNDLAVSADTVYILSAESDSAAGLELTKIAVKSALGPPLASWKSPDTAAMGTNRLSLYAADNFVYIGSVVATAGGQIPSLAIVQDLGASFQIASPPSTLEAGTLRPMGVSLLAFTGAADHGQQSNRIGILALSDLSAPGKAPHMVEASGPAYDMTLYAGLAYVAAGDVGLEAMKLQAANGSHTLPAVTLDSSMLSEAPQQGTLLRLSARVAAADQVRQVDFYLNGQKVASDGNYPFEYRALQTDADAGGRLTVSACAVDIDGNSSCTAPRDLNAANSNTLTVTSMTPTAGGHLAHAKTTTLLAQFSQSLDPSTVAVKNVSLMPLSKTGSDTTPVVLGTVSYQSAAKSIAIQPKLPLSTGRYRVTLSAAIHAATGAKMASSYSWTFNIDPTTVNWSSPISGNWSTASNWTGGAVPANGDNVVINETPGVTVTLNSGSPEVQNLTVGATNTLLISGGNLSVIGTGSIATLDLSSGSIGGPGTITVNSSVVWTSGGITGVLAISSKATMQMNTPFNSSFYLAAGTINNSGTVTQSFSGTPGAYTGVQVSQGGVINNLAGGVWNVISDVWIYATDSSPVAFNNTGTFNKTGGSNTSLWSMPFNGAGPVNIQSGTLTLNGHSTGTLSSPIAISAQCTVNYGQGGTLAGSKVTGPGTLNFTAATVVSGAYNFAGLTQIQSGSGAVTFQNAASIATLNLISGAVSGPGPITVTGTMDWTSGGISSTLVIPAKATLQVNTPFNSSFYIAAGTINNSGTVNQSFAGTPGAYTGVQMSQGGVINNLAGGVWNVISDVWIYATDNSAVAFNNTGTFNKAGGTNTSLWSVPINGAGPINIQSGTLTLNGHSTGTLSAPIAISAQCTVNYGQGGTLAGGTVTGAGTLNFTAATVLSGAYTFAGLTQIQGGSAAITFQNPTTIASLNLISGVLSGPGPVTVTTMDWTSGGISSTLVIPAKATLQINTPFNSSFYLAAGTINNSGTVTQSFAGTPGAYTGVQMSQGGVINNLAGGVWNVVSDVWIYATDNSAVSFNNTGTFNKSGGTNTSLWSVPFNGAGPINLQSGTLTLNGHFTGMLAAPIAITANCVLNYGQGGTLDGGKVAGAGTMNFTTATQVSGTYTFAGVTQIESGSGAVSFQNATQIAALNLVNGVLAGPGTVTVTGTMDWTSGGITGVLVIPAKATLLINTPFNSSFYLAGGTINNSGTVKQSFAGTPGAYTGVQVSQSGVINNLTGGVWNITSDVWIYATDNSAVSFNNTGTFTKTGGTNTSLWSLPFTGAGPINIQSGTLTLNGHYNGTLTAPIAIAAQSTVNYAQGGTLAGAKVTGAGTMNFTAAAVVSGAYSFAGLTQIESGTTAISFQNPTTMAALNLINGVLAGAGPVTVTGAMDWTSGGITGDLVIPAKATLQINTPFNSSFYLAGGMINNSGTVTQSFAGTPGAYTGVQLSQNAAINNLAGGVWNIISDVWVYVTDGSAVLFNNAGTLNKTGGTSNSIWSLPVSNTGTMNLNAGTTSLTGIFPTSKLSGTINIAASTVLNFAHQGTLTNGKATGAGTFDLTPNSTIGSNSITGTYQIKVPSQLLGGTLNVNVAATLNAGTLTLTNATLTVAGTTSIGKLNVTATTGNSTGGTVSGSGSITVSDTLTWTAGTVNVTGVFNVQNLSLSSNSAMSFALGGSALSVNAKLTLNGQLTLTLKGSNPAVGTVFQVLNFANNYLGGFLNLNIPILGSNDYLQETLTGSGLSFVVQQNQPNVSPAPRS